MCWFFLDVGWLREKERERERQKDRGEENEEENKEMGRRGRWDKLFYGIVYIILMGWMLK